MDLKRRPNIIFLLSDQQRPDTMGCYGQALNVTPELDRLAADGTVFEHAFSVQPLCGPSRACLQTGRYATETGCFKNGIALPDRTGNLGSLFSANGYRTGYIGKWHLATGGHDDEHLLDTPVPPNMRGGYQDRFVVSNLVELTSNGQSGYLFDDNEKVFFNGYRVDAITDYGLSFIDDYRDEPFFLTISYLEPHQQNNTDTHECPIGTEHDFDGYQPPIDLLPGVGNWEKEFARYLSCCRSLDDNVGRIVERLKQYGIFDDTVIVYTSDHGSHFRTRPGTYKRSCHEASIRVPLIFHGGAFSGGRRMNGMAILPDVPVTLLCAAGIKPPSDVRGVDLAAYLADEDAVIREEVFVQISESELGRVLRTDRWKLHITAADPALKATAHTGLYRMAELYDLADDPGEHTNRLHDPACAEIREVLAGRITAWIRSIEGIDIRMA
jgi:arylsulfatase A-like enzyme